MAATWEFVSANDVVPGDVTRYGKVIDVTGAGRLRIVGGKGWQQTWHAGKPVEVLR